MVNLFTRAILLFLLLTHQVWAQSSPTPSSHPMQTGQEQSWQGSLDAFAQNLPKQPAMLQSLQQMGAKGIQIELGRVDPRLKLAPCQRTEAFVPPGLRMWGSTRLGLRCVQGSSLWSTTVPVTIKVFAMALVYTQNLPFGTVIGPEHIALVNTDISQSQAMIHDDKLVLGRSLNRAVSLHRLVSPHDLRSQIWFEAGQTIRLISQGEGFSIHTEGVAQAQGQDGQLVRVKLSNGTLVQAKAIALGTAEVAN